MFSNSIDVKSGLRYLLGIVSLFCSDYRDYLSAIMIALEKEIRRGEEIEIYPYRRLAFGEASSRNIYDRRSAFSVKSIH